MKAAVYKKYGAPDVINIVEVDKPVPGDCEILVKIHATTVRAGDWRMRRADPFMARIFNGLFKPKRINVLGMELAGEVVATGRSVSRFENGDHVFATTGLKFGAHAEYCCLPEKGIVETMPENLCFEEAAAIPSGGLAALCLLAGGKICCGRSVLIIGASGGVGVYSVQIAKYYGAEVTGVCRSDNIEFIKSLGADKVIDYTQGKKTEFTGKYDLVCDCAGKMISGLSKLSISRLLKKNGKYVSIEMSYKENAQDLVFLKELIEAGRIKPVIDRVYTLEQIRDAHRYVEKLHKKGNVVVRIN